MKRYMVMIPIGVSTSFTYGPAQIDGNNKVRNEALFNGGDAGTMFKTRAEAAKWIKKSCAYWKTHGGCRVNISDWYIVRLDDK